MADGLFHLRFGNNKLTSFTLSEQDKRFFLEHLRHTNIDKYNEIMYENGVLRRTPN
jgi:hypothetical protein